MTDDRGSAEVGKGPGNVFTTPSRAAEAVEVRARGTANRRPSTRRPSNLTTETDLDRAVDWVWGQVSRKLMKQPEAKILLELIRLRSDRLASSTLTALQKKVDKIERSRVADATGSRS